MMIKKAAAENENIIFEIINGVLHATYKPTVINETIAKEVVNFRMNYIEGESYPTLIKNIGIAKIEKGARDFFSTSEGIAGLTAGAIISNSIFQTTIGNFFLKVSKPPLPARLFNQEEEALFWLQQFK